MSNSKIILASSSPRRIEMMKENGFEPIIMPPCISEELPANIPPKDAVLFLALKKALSVEESAIQKGHGKGDIIIAADTIVYLNEIIGKPDNPQEATAILKALRGKAHLVITGVAILHIDQPMREVFCETTKVFFKTYSDEVIKQYVSTPEPYDKAGGYAIQGTFGQYIDHIEGDLQNVIGFPWNQIIKRLQKTA